jgi:hypothetical protein
MKVLGIILVVVVKKTNLLEFLVSMLNLKINGSHMNFFSLIEVNTSIYMVVRDMVMSSISISRSQIDCLVLFFDALGLLKINSAWETLLSIFINKGILA